MKGVCLPRALHGSSRDPCTFSPCVFSPFTQQWLNLIKNVLTTLQCSRESYILIKLAPCCEQARSSPTPTVSSGLCCDRLHLNDNFPRCSEKHKDGKMVAWHQMRKKVSPVHVSYLGQVSMILKNQSVNLTTLAAKSVSFIVYQSGD